MKPHLIFVNPPTFERWSWQNQDTQGIGGSETSCVEMARRLAARGYSVTCYCPLPDDFPDANREHANVHWRDLDESDYSQPGVWILYRCPHIADKFPAPGTRTDQTLWVVCQDEDYPRAWNGHGDTVALANERQDKLHRVIALCDAQANYYRAKYVRMYEKVCTSSNGLRRDLVDSVLGEPSVERNPHRILYPSSPDRALIPLLEIFWRVRERVPTAELWVAYGFDNIDKLTNPAKWIPWLKEQLKKPGIRHFGRMPQRELYRLWRQCGLWVYPTRFRETSCLRGDTMVNTVSRGPLAIEQIATFAEFRDKAFAVYSCNSKGELAVSAARNCRLTRKDADVVRLVIRSLEHESTLYVTPDHKILSDRKPEPHRTSGGMPLSYSLADDARVYVEAGRLKVGDRVRTITHGEGRAYKPQDTSTGVVLSVDLAGTADVYCMEVEPDHNFIANGVVVHNCITSMEAQALGAIPVVCPVWAVAENVRYGVHIRDSEPTDNADGSNTAKQVPGFIDDPLTLARFVSETVGLMRDAGRQEAIRAQMMPWAQGWYDYENIVTQWVSWIEG